MKTRLTQAKFFVMDEMSMIGRQELGKIEFEIMNTLYGTARRRSNGMKVAGQQVAMTFGRQICCYVQ